MKYFTNVKNQINQMDSHDHELVQEKKKLLLELEMIDEKIQIFKNKIKESNKKYKLDDYKNKPISNLPYIFSKSLFKKEIIIKEKHTNKEFNVFVSDYCFDDQQGLIVSFKEEDNKRLRGLIRKYDIMEDDGMGFLRKSKNKMADFRNIFSHGDEWLFLGVSSKDNV